VEPAAADRDAAVLTGLVLGLAGRRGERGRSRLDLGLLCVAGGGLLGWLVAREPVAAVACVVIADVCAMLMMLPKAYRDPESETTPTFAWASPGGAFAVGAVGEVDVSLLLYPVYFCLADGAMALLLAVRRGAVGAGPAPTARPLICGHPRRSSSVG
jgi:hypothetical protein